MDIGMIMLIFGGGAMMGMFFGVAIMAALNYSNASDDLWQGEMLQLPRAEGRSYTDPDYPGVVFWEKAARNAS